MFIQRLGNHLKLRLGLFNQGFTNHSVDAAVFIISHYYFLHRVQVLYKFSRSAISHLCNISDCTCSLKFGNPKPRDPALYLF